MGKVQGHQDTFLSPKGERQAQVLAQRLSEGNYNLSHLITSDLSRAKKTSEILEKSLACPVSLDSRWREASFGNWEGKSWKELYAPEGKNWQEYTKNWYHYKDHQGESWAEVALRVKDSLSETLEKFAGKNIGIVSHGGTIRLAITVALKLPCEFFPFAMGNTSLTEIVWDRERWTMARMNDCAHLELGKESKCYN